MQHTDAQLAPGDPTQEEYFQLQCRILSNSTATDDQRQDAMQNIHATAGLHCWPSQTQMNRPRSKTRQNFFARSTMTPMLPYLSRADLSNLARSHFNLSVLLRERDMWPQADCHKM